MVSDDPSNRGPVELADLFSRHARRRIEERFAAVFDNDDVVTYRAAQRVLRGEHCVAGTGHGPSASGFRRLTRVRQFDNY